MTYHIILYHIILHCVMSTYVVSCHVMFCVQRLMGISYFNFVNNEAIAPLFRAAVANAIAPSKLPTTSIQIVYFYGQVQYSHIY